MYGVLLMIHSLFRWAVLALLVARTGRGAQAWMSGAPWAGPDKGLSLATVIAIDIQLLLGLVLYAVSPNIRAALGDMGAAMADGALRFRAVEHPTMMVLAIVAVHAGHAISKRGTEDPKRHRVATLAFGLALLFALGGMPWFRGGL